MHRRTFVASALSLIPATSACGRAAETLDLPLTQTNGLDAALIAQTLAAALNHSAFNTANAIGPLLGGMAIAAGYGWTSTAWVGVGLSLGGFAIFVIAWLTGRSRTTA